MREVKIIYRCDECEKKIKRGDEISLRDGRVVCDECICKDLGVEDEEE